MEENTAATPAWDWGEQRVTVGRHFIRDMEGLWSEVLKLAAVVESTEPEHPCPLRRPGRARRPDQAAEARRGSLGSPDRARVRPAFWPCTNPWRLTCGVSPPCSRSMATWSAWPTWPGTSPSASRSWPRIPLALPIPQPLENLGLEALTQVHDSLDALTQANVARAQAVIAADQRIDRHYRSVLKLLKLEIVQYPERINTWLRLVNTARNLERIADHASKIAEAVVYLREGEILRHRPVSSEGGDLSTDRSRTRPKLSQ